MSRVKHCELPEPATLKPGLKVSTDSGSVCQLLCPEYAGHPEGNWVGLLDTGFSIIVTQEEISARITSTNA